MSPPPLTCPQPEPDCGLYEQRVSSPSEILRRAILIERRHYVDLADLVRAETSQPRPITVQVHPITPELPSERPALPPASPSLPLRRANLQKEGSQ